MRKILTIERKPLTIRHVHHPLESTTTFAAVFTTDAPLPDVFRLVGPFAHAQCDTGRKRVDLGLQKKELDFFSESSISGIDTLKHIKKKILWHCIALSSVFYVPVFYMLQCLAIHLFFFFYNMSLRHISHVLYFMHLLLCIIRTLSITSILAR